VGILTVNPQEALDVYGHARVSGTLSIDRLYANLIFAYDGNDHAFLDFQGRSRLLLGSAENTFLYGCVMPSLNVAGTDIAAAISAKQDALSSSSALHVSSVKVTGAISGTSAAEQVEIGRSGNSAQIRISSTYASLRLEGVGQSQNYTGWSIQRNAITHTASVLLGTVSFQSWGAGSNNFHRQVVLHAPLLFTTTGPKLQRTNDNSLELYSGSNQAYKAMTLQGSDGHVIANIGLHNNSDATLKSDVTPASTDDAIGILMTVKPKVYRRNDLQDQSPRLGFIAQDFAAALPPEWASIVGRTGAVEEHIDEDGNQVVAKPSTLTLDYARLNCILWECCRNMHTRLNVLEARLQ
jgi:hypothetical protein